jgi:putative glutamine amidotransferase
VTRPPLIGVTACARAGERHVFHSVAAQYIRAVVDGAGGVPLIIPALGGESDVAALIGTLDGVLLTGSPSNVEPHQYGGPPSREGTLHDAARDATTLPLIHAAIEAGLPLLALCRGNQELNVALGGTLHQNVHELPGKRDHRGRKVPSNEERYGYAHTVELAQGGLLARLAVERRVQVNSLHAQAIDRIAPGLSVEAVSTDDDVIEAVRVTAAKSFALGVQWHPEWHIKTDALSQAIFRSFGDAARARGAARDNPSRSVTAA